MLHAKDACIPIENKHYTFSAQRYTFYTQTGGIIKRIVTLTLAVVAASFATVGQDFGTITEVNTKIIAETTDAYIFEIASKQKYLENYMVCCDVAKKRTTTECTS